MTLSYSTPEALELPAARERLLRTIAAADPARGHKVVLKQTTLRRGVAPFPIKRLRELKYIENLFHTVPSDDPYDDETDTQETPFNEDGSFNVQITEHGRRALASLDAYHANLSERRELLDANRLRRAPGGNTVTRFDAWGEFEIDLYPTTMGKDFALAVERGLIEPIPRINKRGNRITFRLTQNGMVMRKRIVALSENAAGDNAAQV